MKYYSEYVKEIMNGIEYPHKKDFETIFVYDRGKTIFTGSMEEYNNKKGILQDYLHEKVIDKEAYEKAMSEYNDKKRLIDITFKKDLFEEVGADIENEQHNKLYSLIYSDYNQNMNDVVYMFEEYFTNLFN